LDKTPIRLSQRPPRPDQTVEQFHELIDEAYRDAVAAYGNAGIDLEIVEGEADVTVILCTLGEDDCSGEFTALLDTDSGPLALADYPYPYPYHNDLLLQRLNVGRLTEILTHLPSDSERRNLLYWIALHETGHSLGLRHAETESEVMPFEIDLRRLNDRVSLSVTDLAGLQRRYGDMAEPVQIPSDFQGGLVPSPDDPDDPDHDGLPTLFELTVTRTDPDLADTDADRYDDGTEYVNGLDPRNPDTDGDGKWDRDEVEDGTDPWSPMEVIEQGNVRFPVGVATCTIPGANGSARTLALSERDLTHGTLNEGDCVVTYLETGERTAVKGAIVRALTPNERSTCLLGFSEPLQQALDPHNDFGISTGRTLVPLRFDRNLPANPILGPNASIEVIQPGREACIGEETTVLVRVKDVAGGGLSAIP
jgi:predicted Zn-dependent protease